MFGDLQLDVLWYPHSTKGDINPVLGGASGACVSNCVGFNAGAVFVNSIFVERTSTRGSDWSGVVLKLRREESFKDIVKRERPVGPCPECVLGIEMRGNDELGAPHKTLNTKRKDSS